MHVLITGASGLMGRALTRAFRERGVSVTGVTRDPAARRNTQVTWVGWDSLTDAVSSAAAVVHLAGADIAGKRWTAGRKLELRESRIATGHRLAEAIRQASEKPSVLVSASAVGYYGDCGDTPLTEASPPGSDFLARLCVDWEAVTAEAGVRTVQARIGVVLAREGGALPRMLMPFKLGLGATIGRGRQYFPWIHVDDAVRALFFAIERADVSGPLNLTAPQPVTNARFTKALGAALHRPALLILPPQVLQLQLGEGASLLTASQRATPARLQELGFTFEHPEINGALAALLAERGT